MRRLISDLCLFVLLPIWLLLGVAQAQFNSFPPGVFTGRAALDPASGGGGCSSTFALDGTPQQAHSGGTASQALPAFSNSACNQIAYVDIITNGGPVTGVTSANATWSKRTNTINGSTTHELWFAKPAAALTSEVVTVATTTSAFFTAYIFAFSGSHIASPFDGNGAIPSVTNGGTCTFTTSNANDILIAGGVSGNTSPDTSYTLIFGSGTNFLLSEYQIVSATQSASTVPQTSNGTICDAIIKGP